MTVTEDAVKHDDVPDSASNYTCAQSYVAQTCSMTAEKIVTKLLSHVMTSGTVQAMAPASKAVALKHASVIPKTRAKGHPVERRHQQTRVLQLAQKHL